MSDAKAFLVIVRGYVVTNVGDPSDWDPDEVMRNIHGMSCTIREVHPVAMRPCDGCGEDLPAAPPAPSVERGADLDLLCPDCDYFGDHPPTTEQENNQ